MQERLYRMARLLFLFLIYGVQELSRSRVFKWRRHRVQPGSPTLEQHKKPIASSFQLPDCDCDWDRRPLLVHLELSWEKKIKLEVLFAVDSNMQGLWLSDEDWWSFGPSSVHRAFYLFSAIFQSADRRAQSKVAFHSSQNVKAEHLLGSQRLCHNRRTNFRRAPNYQQDID